MEYQILMGIQQMHYPVFDWLMLFISSLGDGGFIWIVCGLLLFISKNYKKQGVLLLLSLLVVLLTGNVLLKNLIARDRPCWLYPEVELLLKAPTDYSFPSGHTMASFAGAVSLYMTKKKWGIAALVLAGLIAFSRMYLFVHWPSDILLGMILGTLISFFVFGIAKKIPTYTVT